MPAKSQAQFKAMAAASHGDSSVIDIDPKKAKEYLANVRMKDLPAHVKPKAKASPKAK